MVSFSFVYVLSLSHQIQTEIEDRTQYLASKMYDGDLHLHLPLGRRGRVNPPFPEDENHGRLRRHNRRFFFNGQMHMIENNDPTFTKLEVGATEVGLYYYYPPDAPDDGWGEFGKAIGINTHLKELSMFGGVSGFISNENILDFLQYFVFNTSIHKLASITCASTTE